MEKTEKIRGQSQFYDCQKETLKFLLDRVKYALDASLRCEDAEVVVLTTAELNALNEFFAPVGEE